MKSIAHPEWPYTGTQWEWRGFSHKQLDGYQSPSVTITWDEWRELVDLATSECCDTSNHVNG
jgi:hypothetical protein